MQLAAFLKTYPPSADTKPASQELLNQYATKLPASLLEIWRTHGLGQYGVQRICLIDPRVWQVTLDRWIVSPPDDAQRIPIAINAFGSIFYYRKLTETDEDVAIINPHLRVTQVLAWSLDDFFNQTLNDSDKNDDLLRPNWVDAAQKQHGMLSTNEVYEADATMLTMEILVTKRTDALQMHKRLRDAVDENSDMEEATKIENPVQLTLNQALPAEWRDFFAALVFKEAPAVKPSVLSALFGKSKTKSKTQTKQLVNSVLGLYLSSHVDRHRLLALVENNTYQLLFFSSDPNPNYQYVPRFYTGAYAAETFADGETLLSLDIAMRDDSTGGDANDATLTVMNSNGVRYLLQYESIDDIAAGIQWNSHFSQPDAVFIQVNLDDKLPEYSENGIKAPPLKDLPPSVRELIPSEPLKVSIVGIDNHKKGEDWMVTVSLGTDDGLIINMPFCSPADTTKDLKGWVWGLNEKNCKIGGLDSEGDSPAIGDILVARDPTAGPLHH
jgi:hypothetical protein